MSPAVELSAIVKRFTDRVAVDYLDLTIPRGSLYGFIGPNGSGKTTTLRMILRIIHPDSGVVRVLGESAGTAVDDRTGYLPEERGLYRRMQVREVLRFHARLKNLRRPDAEITSWLERLDLSDRASARVDTLSKGLAQKVQFITAVLHKPELLVLDEPFAGLDPVNVETLREVMLELRKDGTTVILSTHDMTLAEQVCERVVMLHEGRKVLDGPVAQIKKERGVDSLRVRFAEPLQGLSDPQVERVVDYGHEHLLHLRPGTDPQAVLKRLLARGQLLSFSVSRPSLHEIFVNIARGDPAREALTSLPHAGDDTDSHSRELASPASGAP